MILRAFSKRAEQQKQEPETTKPSRSHTNTPWGEAAPHGVFVCFSVCVFQQWVSRLSVISE